MVAENQFLAQSGTMLLGVSGTYSKVLLCGISNGSAVIPIRVDDTGALMTSGTN